MREGFPTREVPAPLCPNAPATARVIGFASMRYHRQTLLPPIGDAGQARVRSTTVLIVGCGALGTVAAEYLARAGVGTLRICDRDVVEGTNLQRQTLFTEADARDAVPKAVAAAHRLAAVNADVALDPRVTDVHAGNAEALVAGADVIVDGTDNAQTRYLLNDVAVKRGVPWVYGGAVGVEGRVAVFAPPRTACLRCVFPEPPAVGELPSCDTAGVLGPVAGVVGSFQAAAALRLIVAGDSPEHMTVIDGWDGRTRSISLAGARRADCPACAERRFAFLDAPAASTTTTLCGRNAVQVRPPRTTAVDLDQLAARLGPVGTVRHSAFFVRVTANDLELTIFPDGRVVVYGTDSPERARSAVARYVGA